MLRLLKNLVWLVLLAAGVESSFAFSLLGIREPYQVAALNYGGDFSDQPHNLGEEYRWNVPFLYYTFDESFLDYFGSNGVAAVDGAMKILNDTLSTNTSAWSADLSEFPLEGSQINFTAQALHLFDLKSATLEMMVEHLGLLDPERFTWTLRNRISAGPCPLFLYTVIKRNFDPVSLLPSSYVNGNLFTYSIIEGCPAVQVADAVEILVDPDGLNSTAIASPKITVNNTAFYGYYHVGLTRDDVGGLRYLFNTNIVHNESAGVGTTTFITNNFSQLLATTNFSLFAEQALTNDAPTLLALYPNLVIISSSNFFARVTNVVITPRLINSPYAPFGTPPQIGFTSNSVVSVQTFFHHTFANLFTVRPVNGSWVTVPITDVFVTNAVVVTAQNVLVSPFAAPFSPLGSFLLHTNISSRNFVTNTFSGEYFILPTNACDLQILSPPILTYTNSYTNLLGSATNILTVGGGTNVTTTGTNIVESFTQNLITYSTNHIFVVYPIACQPTNVVLRQGMDGIKFVRRDFDSLLGRFWSPITNTYSVRAMTNNVFFSQTIQRVITAPDFIFSAGDLVSGPTAAPLIIPTVARPVPVFGTNGFTPLVGGVLFGPGTFEPVQGQTFIFSKIGPLYANFGPFFIDETTADLDYVWASYDGSTNAPIIYPNSLSLSSIENQLMIQIFPKSLPDGAAGVPYSFTYTNTASGVVYLNAFSGAGGQPPYSFSLAPGSAGLPPGFNALQTDGTFLGGSPGTPTAGGRYDFTLRLTDAGGRFVDRPFTIFISP
jgi:hypothetical protein